MDFETWACPECLSTLEPSDDGFRCTSKGHRFEVREGLPLLLRTSDEAVLRDGESYAAAWKRDKLAPPRGSALDLPYVPSRYWRPKARSLEALLRILGPAGGRKVADVGAGTGWLSYRLAEAGFRPYAIDVLVDPEIGLGAAAAYDATRYGFERAIATLTRWPFRTESLDVAVCNASLHYLADVMPAIAEARRTLRPDGIFIVMNDPVHSDRRSAVRAAHDFQDRMRAEGGSGRLVDGHRHFVASDFEAALRSEFTRVTRHDPDYGIGFRVTRAVKSLVLRMEVASFPMYVASRTS